MRYWRGPPRSSAALVRAAPAAVAIVSCSIVVSRARFAMHEDAPALDADLVRGYPHPWVFQTPAGAEVEGLLVDGRGDLRDASLVTDDPAREHEGVAERIEVVDGEEPIAGADDRHLPPPHQGADSGPGNDVLERADVLLIGRVGLLEGDGGHSASCGTRWSFSFQVAGRCWARWGTRTRLGSGSAEFTKVRKRASLVGSSRVAFHS